MSRTRVVVWHPNYGPMVNHNALRVIEAQFQDLERETVNPFLLPWDFASWPRWKKASWKASKLGQDWKVQVFREPRSTRLKHSAFWSVAKAMGQPFRRRKRGDF